MTINLFTGTSNYILATSVSNALKVPLANIEVGKFSDGEIKVEIHENVRDKPVYILQSTCSPCNDNLMELAIIADALRRSSAGRITAIIPYYGYSRQDRRPGYHRVPITASLIGDILAASGIEHIVTIDLHATQIQGMLHVSSDNLMAGPILFKNDIMSKFVNPLMVSPDVGGVARTRELAKKCGDADLAIIDKRRPKANEAEIMNIIGDIADRECVIVDDMIDTAGTLCGAASALKKHGATKVVAYATHGVFSGRAIENINASALDEVVVTDTIPMNNVLSRCSMVRQISVAPMLSDAITRIHHGDSVSSIWMYDEKYQSK